MTANQRIKSLLDNWPTKIICFCLSILIYFFYQTSTLDTRHISVPLKIHDDGITALAGDIPRYVRITLRGKTEEIAQILESDISAYLDADLVAVSGVHTLPVSISLSSQATLIDPLEVKVSPSSVAVKLEERSVKFVPVRTVFAGNTAEGYILDSYKIDPDFIQITGIKSAVDSTVSIPTQAVTLEQLSKSSIQNVSLINLNKQIKIVDTSIVQVSLSIVPKQSTKSFTLNDVVYLDLPEQLAVSSSAQSITFEIAGEQNLLTSLILTADSASVDCSLIEMPGVYELPVSMKVPEGFTIKNIMPSKIIINVELLETVRQREEVQEHISSENVLSEDGRADDQSSAAVTSVNGLMPALNKAGSALSEKKK